MQLSDKVYEVVKWLVAVVIPAVSSAYFALGAIWGLPATEQVVGTLAILATFLGTVLGVSTVSYRSSGSRYDGQMIVTEDPGGLRQVNLQLNGDPEDFLLSQGQVVFEVVKTQVE